MRVVNLKRLSLENIKRKPLRTAALIMVAACLSAVFFGGSLLSMNLSHGLQSMRQRLGADIMVTPQGTRTQAEALLTGGASSTFYFTNNIDALVRESEGVEAASVQTYISSLSASCCAARLQIIGFDPASDFVIGPWIASQYKQGLRKGEMIAGANVLVSYRHTVRLYGHQWPIVAQLAKTGTSLDNSVFVNRQTVPQIVEYSARVGHQAIPHAYANKAISAVLVKVRKGYRPQQVARNIRRHSGLSSIGIVFPGGITATTKASLTVLTHSIVLVVAIFWIIGVLVLLAVFAASVNERKREFASLRLLGATRRMLVRMVVRESLTIATTGGVIGVGVASLILFPYHTLIAQQLQLPYLQTSALPVVGLMVAALAFSLLTVMVASVLVTVRIAMNETYITLREGQ